MVNIQYAPGIQRRAGRELPRVETQSGLAQASFVIGPLGRLPFRLRSASRVTNPRCHLRRSNLEEHEATQGRGQHSVSAQSTKAVVGTVALHYPARRATPPDPAATGFSRRQLTKCQRSSITRSHRRERTRPLPEPRPHSCCVSPLRRDAVIARYQQSTRGPPGPSGEGGAEVTCPASPFLQTAVTSEVVPLRPKASSEPGPAGPGRGETTRRAP